MKKESATRLILAAVVISSSLLGVKAVQAATELARVNGTVLTLEDFQKRYKESLKFFQFKAPSQKSMLEEMIKREISLQQAKKMGLDRDPEVIDQMNTVLIQAFINKKLSKQFDTIQVTDSEAESWYSQNPEIRTSHIFVAVRPDAKAEDAKKALATIQEIQKKYLASGKQSFAEVAQKYSEGSASTVGGDIGWQNKAQLDPAYFAAASKLSVGGTSSIVKSQFGYHIIKLTGKKGWGEVDHAMIKRIVFDERRQQIYDSFMKQLRGQAQVQTHSELIKD